MYRWIEEGWRWRYTRVLRDASFDATSLGSDRQVFSVIRTVTLLNQSPKITCTNFRLNKCSTLIHTRSSSKTLQGDSPNCSIHHNCLPQLIYSWDPLQNCSPSLTVRSIKGPNSPSTITVMRGQL